MQKTSEQLFAETRNRESALELGWDPGWFGLDPENYGPDLTAAVDSLQTSSLGIAKGDGDLPGIVGWATFLRMHEALAYEVLPEDEEPEPEEPEGFLLINDELMPVPFKVRQMPLPQDYWRCPTKVDGVRCDPKRYDDPGRCSGCGAKRKHGRRYRKRDGLPARAIWHWPVTETTKATHRVLTAKGISSNGEVSWDGTFAQFCDLKYRTFHAGSRVNNAGVGFDVSLNPVRKKKIEARQKKIEGWGRPARPVIDGLAVHGWKPGPMLWYYDAQLITVAGLLAALSVYLDLPISWPCALSAKGFEHAAAQSFIRDSRGHFNHSDVSGKKWDACLGPLTRIESLDMTLDELAHQLESEMRR